MLYNAATLNLLDTNAGIDGHYIDEVFDFKDSDGKPFKLVARLKVLNRSLSEMTCIQTSSDEIMRLELTISPIRTTYTTNTQEKRRLDRHHP